jgi:hypothetical protein
MNVVGDMRNPSPADEPPMHPSTQAGFNLLLYGVGSKRALLERFAELLRKEGVVVVVDGLDPRAARAGARLLEIAAEYGHGPAAPSASGPASGAGGCGFEYGAAGPPGLLSFGALMGMQAAAGMGAGVGGGDRGGGAEEEDEDAEPLPAGKAALGRRTLAARACKAGGAAASASAASSSSAAATRHANPEIPLFFVIHSLDSRALASGAGGKAMLEALVELAGRPSVHLVASVDHLNSPLLFSARHLEALSLVWHDVTTLTPYGGAELAGAQGGDALLYGRGGQTLLPAGEGLRYLLQCVTRRHLELLQFLAARQLEEEEAREQRRREEQAAAAAARKRRRGNPGEAAPQPVGGGGKDKDRDKEKEETGITFEDLALQCASKLISRSHGNLRQLFDELLDHRLLKSKGIGTQTRYWIPRSTRELRMIVAYKG